MGQLITGSIKIFENDYPFSHDKETEKITVYIGAKAITVPEDMDIIVGQKYGMMTGGKILYKLSSPLSNDCMAFEGGTHKYISFANQIRSIEYYIEDYQENSKYTEMRLQFPELNYFIPSIGRATVLDEQFVFSRVKDTMCSFSFKYHDTDVTVFFVAKTAAHSNVKTTAETISEVVLTFPETEDFEYLRGLYELTRCFFTFVCNRKNIGLRNAVFIGNYPTKTFRENKVVDEVVYTEQKIFFSQKYLEPEEDKKQVAKTPNWGLFSENLAGLFRLFSEESLDSIATVNGNSIHHSIKYRNLIDLEQSLHITATFEYYVRTLLPEMSSKSTIDFIHDLDMFLDEYIEKSSGKKRQKAQKFKRGLNPQISLEGKIQKVYDGYSTWEPLKPILEGWFGDKISVLASAANSWRNELAHEKREYRPNNDVIDAIRLLEHMNYCIVFRQAGYSDEQIKDIISESLVR